MATSLFQVPMYRRGGRIAFEEKPAALRAAGGKRVLQFRTSDSDTDIAGQLESLVTLLSGDVRRDIGNLRANFPQLVSDEQAHGASGGTPLTSNIIDLLNIIKNQPQQGSKTEKALRTLLPIARERIQREDGETKPWHTIRDTINALLTPDQPPDDDITA